MKKRLGSIARIIRGRKFGFIQPADDMGDVLFHFENLGNIKVNQLKEGLPVKFDLMPDANQENRIRAKNVQHDI